MQEWIKVAVAVLPVVILFVLVLVLLRQCCSSKGHREFINQRRTTTEGLQPGITKLHLAYDANNHKNLKSLHHEFDIDKKSRPNYHVFRRGVSAKPLFSWADHPSLVSEAVEHGWSRFAFTGYMPSPSTRPSLLGLCAVGDQGRETEISWEVFPGSPDFMQKIRLNSGLKRIYMGTPPLGASCVLKTALPIPGPPLGNSSFPQEAYFEITILSSRENDFESSDEGNDNNKFEELELRSKKEGKVQAIMLKLVTTRNTNSKDLHRFTWSHDRREIQISCEKWVIVLSLTRDAFTNFLLSLTSCEKPIHTHSLHPSHLSGMKLVFEAEKAEWGSTDKVIGCGFDPGRKKVFFTVDSELMHVIHCTSEEFGSPLYPTLAANHDVTILVNFGQSAFMYPPANVERSPNPCFIGPHVNSPAGALGYEDSRELFSMGRIDSTWLNQSMTKDSHNNGSNNTAVDVDDESEADLFEIVLDNCDRSPTPVL
ncbi:hypothetical protein HHK36_030962 [Tetracentron sinense]|uniref:B30.2/SPRY domain-containing protein n=1 Tax=Tetracentron sinense TaxID=13715 RepID=A0A834YDT7_TETSI|nr:hypothetical protein HHK36_030962 [Tetracentron sinense]